MSQRINADNLELTALEANPALKIPQGVYRDAKGKLWRLVPRQVQGEVKTFARDIALDQSEARSKFMDWFNPVTSIWLIDGFKAEQDRTVQSIMEDSSESLAFDPDKVAAEREVAMQKATAAASE
jgi:hypothetical protein